MVAVLATNLMVSDKSSIPTYKAHSEVVKQCASTRPYNKSFSAVSRYIPDQLKDTRVQIGVVCCILVIALSCYIYLKGESDKAKIKRLEDELVKVKGQARKWESKFKVVKGALEESKNKIEEKKSLIYDLVKDLRSKRKELAAVRGKIKQYRDSLSSGQAKGNIDKAEGVNVALGLCESNEKRVLAKIRGIQESLKAANKEFTSIVFRVFGDIWDLVK